MGENIPEHVFTRADRPGTWPGTSLWRAQDWEGPWAEKGGISSQQRVQRQDRKSGRKQTRSATRSCQPGCGVVVGSAARPDPPPRAWEPGAQRAQLAEPQAVLPWRRLARGLLLILPQQLCVGRREPAPPVGGERGEDDFAGVLAVDTRTQTRLEWPGDCSGPGGDWATCITSHYKPLTYTSFLVGFPLRLLFSFWFKLST